MEHGTNVFKFTLIVTTYIFRNMHINYFDATHISLFILSSCILSSAANDIYPITNTKIRFSMDNGIGISKNDIENDTLSISNGSYIQNWYLLFSGTIYKLDYSTDAFNSTLNSSEYWWYNTIPKPNQSAIYTTNITLIKPNITFHSSNVPTSSQFTTPYLIADVTYVSITDTHISTVENTALNTDETHSETFQDAKLTLNNFFGNDYIYVFIAICLLCPIFCLYICILIICRLTKTRKKERQHSIYTERQETVYIDAEHETQNLATSSPDVIHIVHQSTSEDDKYCKKKKIIKSQNQHSCNYNFKNAPNGSKHLLRAKSVATGLSPAIHKNNHNNYNASNDLLQHSMSVRMPQSNANHYPNHHMDVPKYKPHAVSWNPNYNYNHCNTNSNINIDYCNKNGCIQNVSAGNLIVPQYRHQHYCNGNCGFKCNGISNSHINNNGIGHTINNFSVSNNNGGANNFSRLNSNVPSQRSYGNIPHGPNVKKVSFV
eukprot:171517_1